MILIISLIEPGWGWVCGGDLHVHEVDGIPGGEDQHPDHVQRPEASDPRRPQQAMCGQPHDRPATQSNEHFDFFFKAY